MRHVHPLLVLCLALLACGSEPERGGPNVVLIVMDTARADRCSVNGYDRETTPRLAALSTEATTYTDAWTPAGWTAPAHASLFTGFRPEHHGYLRGNRMYLLPESDTLAELLRDAGYRTACFTNNNSIAPYFGLTQGFEKVVPLYSDESLEYPWAPLTHRLALEWAIDKHRAGDRFFLFINDMEPHYPYTPPAESASRFVRPGTPADFEAWGRDLKLLTCERHNTGLEKVTPERMEYLRDLYDGEIHCLDDAIGTLVDGLREEGILDETVFVVTSDHGENFGDHGLMDHVFSLHRSICHVPLMIRYPPRFEGGKKVKDVVRLEDVPLTLLELCGLPAPEGLDGRSLLSDVPGRYSLGALGPPLEYLDALMDRHEAQFDPEPLKASLRSVYDGRHHLIRYSDGREELYDLESDPREVRNQAPVGGEVLERLRGLLERAVDGRE